MPVIAGFDEKDDKDANHHPPRQPAGLMFALCAGVAHGQAADGKVQSLGNAGAGASIMSREELRACQTRRP